jgi:hypothetical protein
MVSEAMTNSPLFSSPEKALAFFSDKKPATSSGFKESEKLSSVSLVLSSNLIPRPYSNSLLLGDLEARMILLFVRSIIT